MASEHRANVKVFAEAIPGFRFSDWDFDESLDEAIDLHTEVDAGMTEFRRSFHSSHNVVATPHYMDRPFEGDGLSDPAQAESEDSTRRRASPITWALLCFGIAMLMCGASLMVASLVSGRPELWPVGTPLAITGQAMLLIGLVVQLDVIWQSSEDNATTLKAIQVGSTYGSAWDHRNDQAHPVHPPSAQMMIADMKGQLERLSVHVAER